MNGDALNEHPEPATPAIDKRTLGLYGKFRVERTDGKSAPGQRHEHCDYFVLDRTHDPFAIPALRAYADACADEYPSLAKDLRLWLAAWDGFQDRPAPVVGDDEAIRAWLDARDVVGTTEAMMDAGDDLAARLTAALADVATKDTLWRAEIEGHKQCAANADKEIATLKAALAAAEQEKEKAVAEEREAMKQACKAIGANFRIQAKAAAGKSFHNEENDYLMRSYGVNECVEAIRARAGRNDG